MDTKTNEPRSGFKIQQEDLPDLAIIGASYIAHLGLDFAKYSDAMVNEFGESVKLHLPDLFKKSQGIIESEVDKSFGKQE